MKRTANYAPDNAQWKKSIPVPVYEEKPEYIAFYERAWELAHDHVKDIPGMPQTPYMDEACSYTDIWIWDTCFMVFFCKYAPDVFPGIQTLNNFYQVLHDGKPLPRVRTTDGKAAEPGDPADITAQLCLHIPDNPPLFAWAEYEHALMTGDMEHLQRLCREKEYLRKHFDFLEHLTQPGWKNDYTRAPTCLVKRPDGYYWEGGRSGMDNTVRGRLGEHARVSRPNNPELLWVDAISQQALFCLYAARIEHLVGREDEAAEWMSKYNLFKDKVNTLYWDEEDGIYYDLLESSMKKLKILTPASFWPLLADIPSPARAERMRRLLTDETKLGGVVPWVTLSRDDPDFSPDGNYWRGSVWLPTAYMGLKALEKYGEFELARTQGRTILEHMYRTWREFEPHTIWECYSPTKHLPATKSSPNMKDRFVRPHFCGWSALGPISIFLENVIGVTGADAIGKTVTWHLPHDIKGAVGIRNYTFGDITASFVVKNGTLETESDGAFTLRIDGTDYSIPAGTAAFKL